MAIQMRQPGECASLVGVNTDDILATLGAGNALPADLRHATEVAFKADFGDVRVHADAPAERLAADLGAAAFTVGRHIVFGEGAYRPENSSGYELLSHELNHALEHPGEKNVIRGWFSKRLNNTELTPKEKELLGLDPKKTLGSGVKYYKLFGKPHLYVVGAKNDASTHEEITVKALEKFQHLFGSNARYALLWFCAEVDAWKSQHPSGYPNKDFSVLEKILVQKGEYATCIVPKLHAYITHSDRDPKSSKAIQHTLQAGDIGIDGVRINRDGGGVVNGLLRAAMDNFRNGYTAHAWRLLGVSLHVIQDFYAHNVPIGNDLRTQAHKEFAKKESGDLNKSIMEDDPDVDRRLRWNNAIICTVNQLQLFCDEFSNDRTLRERLHWNWRADLN